MKHEEERLWKSLNLNSLPPILLPLESMLPDVHHHPSSHFPPFPSNLCCGSTSLGVLFTTEDLPSLMSFLWELSACNIRLATHSQPHLGTLRCSFLVLLNQSGICNRSKSAKIQICNLDDYCNKARQQQLLRPYRFLTRNNNTDKVKVKER